ncbi:TonB-dependent receptor plug domain-containing protein [Reichenbachiella versicolor]|uniref:TonB-dependent receptor plug domain-containing protein n=1 Tax=Reichenbachiella versicolor TaxID=1821036 RepID=UPI0013A562E4|nr:TonB-dependent receptor [Reichenbachiella versicolor]
MLFCWLVGVCAIAEAQILTIKEGLTHRPISNVSILIKNQEEPLLTDDNGQISMRKIKDVNQFVLSHPGYETKSLSVSDINQERVVYMTEKVIEIDEVQITANRWLQDKRDVPNEIVQIGGRHVMVRNPQTSADMLGQTGQVFIQKSQMGGGSPMIRGFSANSVLIVLDGVRINNAIYRSGNLHNIITLDPNSLESTDVIFGPSSTLYGSDALGGVMHFKTLETNYSSEGKLIVGGSAMLRFASANDERTGSASLQLSGKNISNVTSITVSQFDDLRMGANRTGKFPDYGKRYKYIDRVGNQDVFVQNSDENIQKFSGYGQINAMNKLSYKMGRHSEFQLLTYYSNSSDVPRYDRLLQRNSETGELINAEWYYGPQFMLLNALSYINTSVNPAFNTLKITLSNQMVDESRHDRKYQSESLRHREEKVDVYSLNVDAEKKLGLQGRLFYGGEALLNEVTSIAFRENIITRNKTDTDSRYPNGGSDYSSAALYAQYNQRTSRYFAFNAGARYTYVTLNELFLDTEGMSLPFYEINQSNQALSGSAGVVVSPSSNLDFRLLFSSGFRAPNVDDMGKVFEVDGGSVVVPNEDLKPEQSYNYEVGVDWVVGDALRIEGNVYYSDLKNAMVRRPFSLNGQDSIMFDNDKFAMSALDNAGEAYVWGYSIGLNAAFNQNLGFEGRINVCEGMDEVEKVPLRHAYPMFGKAAITWQRNKLRAEFYSHFQAKKEFDDLAPSEQEKTHLYTVDGALSWYTLNIRAAYRFTDSWSVTAALENLMDTHYRPYSSGISAAGVNGILSARYQF